MEEVKYFLDSKKEKTVFIAIHNITEKKLKSLFDLNLEGIPSPSVQIKPFPTSLNEALKIEKDDSLNNFGEISFIFNQQNIFGKNKTIQKNDISHQIFSGDGYTQRFPEIYYSLDIKKFNLLKKDLVEISNHSEAVLSDDITLKLDNSKKNKDKDYCKENLEKSFLMKLLYIKEINCLNEFKASKRKRVLNPIFKNNKKFKKLFETDLINTISKDNKNNIIQEFEKIRNEIKDEEELKVFNIIYCNDNNEISFQNIANYHRDDIKQLFKEIYEIDKDKTLKRLNVIMKKNSNILTFNEFVDLKLNKIHHSPKIKDNKKEANLDNIFLWMRKNRGLDIENNQSNINSIGSRKLNVLRSFDDLIDNLNNIVSYKEKIFLKKNRFKLFFDIKNKLSVIDDIQEERLLDAISKMGSYPSLDKVKVKLEESSFNCNDDELLNIIKNFAIKINNPLSEYYEAKPQKIFYFNDKNHNATEDKILSSVLVPKNIDKNILSKLKETGIEVIQYNKNDTASKMRAFYKCRENFIKEPPALKRIRKQKI